MQLRKAYTFSFLMCVGKGQLNMK